MPSFKNLKRKFNKIEGKNPKNLKPQTESMVAHPWSAETVGIHGLASCNDGERRDRRDRGRRRENEGGYGFGGDDESVGGERERGKRG